MAERKAYRDEEPKSLTMRSFVGIDQSVDTEDMDFRYSKTAYNCDTRGGILRPASGFAAYGRFQAASGVIRTIAPWFSSTDGTVKYIAFTSTDALLNTSYGGAWSSIKGGLPISNGDFSFVNYQNDSKDMVVMTNGTDDIYRYSGSGSLAKLTPTSPVVPKGKDIALANERLWVGVFASGANINALYWSDDQNPDNWTISTEEGGTLQNPTWDGDKITAIATLFGEIVVFKKRSAFRILGAYPKEFRVEPIATSIGALTSKSVAQYHSAAFFMSDDGIAVYDGVSCKILGGKALKDVMASRNRDYDTNARAIIHKDRLYMAFTTDANTTNNRVIEYDLIEGTFMSRTGIGVNCWLQVGDKLYFANTTSVYEYGSGTTYAGDAITMRWDTPMSTLGTPNAIKRAVRAYIVGKGGDVKLTTLGDNGTTSEVTVTLPSSIGTVQTRITGRGRRLGWKIENVSGSTPEISEIRIEYEEDED